MLLIIYKGTNLLSVDIGLTLFVSPQIVSTNQGVVKTRIW